MVVRKSFTTIFYDLSGRWCDLFFRIGIMTSFLITCLVFPALRISSPWEYHKCQKVQYAWGYLPVPGRHVMMYLYLIGRVAGNGDNKEMELESPP